MRVISGNLKGRSFNFIRNTNTRPLKDIVKENIFNILTHSKLIKTYVKDANVLDLYSGIGSFGIECISRGANKVTFVEYDKNASEILKNNLKQLSINNKTEVFKKKIENFLSSKIKEKFNIFFLDPPFSDLDFLKNLNLIKKNNIFHKDHIIIIHREKKSKDNYKNLISVIDTKQYGRSKIIFGVFI
tara:strand:- start:1732 stop:2292 length:561 start_codon:yes stop_codon:yes gene_type:complete